MDGNPWDREVEEQQARLAAEQAQLAAQVAAARQRGAVAFGAAGTAARHGLDVGGLVFGLTIAFVVPAGSFTRGELVFLGLAIISLGVSILLNLVVAIDASGLAGQLQYQISDEDLVSTLDQWTKHIDRDDAIVNFSLTMCGVGIITLTGFALLRLPAVT